MNHSAVLLIPTLGLSGAFRLQAAIYLSRCRAIREHQGTIPFNPPCWNRSIPSVEASNHFSFVITGHKPQHATRPVDNRIGQRHPASSLIISGEGDVRVL